MRLIHSVRRPTNISLLRQFQQCQLSKPPSARLHPVLIKPSNLVNGSKILWHERAYATSASSDAIEARKPQRRVSKKERKLMVENFVKKYRETNAGKFPTAGKAKENVGGSYYTVRLILQELIHDSKQPLLDTTKNSLEKTSARKDDKSTNVVEASQTGELEEVIMPISKENIGNPSSKILKSKQGKQPSVSVETDKAKDVGRQPPHLIGKPESSDLPVPENNIKREKLEKKVKFDDGLEPKDQRQKSSRRELQKVPNGDAESQNKSSVWNNLKSFANGFFNLWKRS